ncbi:MAG: hypothetical protein FWH55_03480 [Oscillospiraceae bacterium]|nr:hypothetical protein [Oscillospiraceae bacterium]
MIMKKNIFYRLIIYLVAGVIILPSFWGVTSAAAATIDGGKTDAEICGELGVLLGSGEGLDSSYLLAYTTREQAAYITLRLMGKEADGSAYMGVRSFKDINENSVGFEEGRRMLNFLRNNPQYGWQGDNAGNFNPAGLLTAQAMYKVALTVLGYKVDEDFKWEDTLTFARGKGMGALGYRVTYLSNSDVASILIETLKANIKDQRMTLCEYLIDQNVISAQKAFAVSMTPGSPGYKPLLSYKNGGPLISEISADLGQNRLRIGFNINLNPSYAKSLKHYEYFVYGKGYVPLPLTCITSMPDETTVVIQFPERGWAEGNVPPMEAFTTYIATYGRNEIKISGLLDADENLIDDVLIDVPR